MKLSAHARLERVSSTSMSIESLVPFWHCLFSLAYHLSEVQWCKPLSALAHALISQIHKSWYYLWLISKQNKQLLTVEFTTNLVWLHWQHSCESQFTMAIKHERSLTQNSKDWKTQHNNQHEFLWSDSGTVNIKTMPGDSDGLFLQLWLVLS